MILLNCGEGFYIPDDDYVIYNRSSWVPFNEGWGQFDSVKIANLIKSLDKTRFVDHASGYVDHFGPDFKSLHIYFEKIHFDKDEINRPIVVSEYGGYGLRIKNHLGCSEYFSYIMFKDKKDLTMNIKNLLSDEIYPAMKRGLCAAVYTQLSDVEQEINGFLTYDRKVLKVNASEIKQVNDMIKLK